jgi:hypothetical protein
MISYYFEKQHRAIVPGGQILCQITCFNSRCNQHQFLFKRCLIDSNEHFAVHFWTLRDMDLLPKVGVIADLLSRANSLFYYK